MIILLFLTNFQQGIDIDQNKGQPESDLAHQKMGI
jgi:hypothetical protein